MTTITEHAQLRAQILKPGSSTKMLREFALQLVDMLEAKDKQIAELTTERDSSRAREVRWLAVSEEKSKIIAELEARTEHQPDYFINRIDTCDGYGPDTELRAYTTELDALKSRADHGGRIVALFAAPTPVTVKLRRKEPTSSGHYGEGYLVDAPIGGSALDYDETVEVLTAAGIKIAEDE